MGEGEAVPGPTHLLPPWGPHHPLQAKNDLLPQKGAELDPQNTGTGKGSGWQYHGRLWPHSVASPSPSPLAQYKKVIWPQVFPHWAGDGGGGAGGQTWE